MGKDKNTTFRAIWQHCQLVQSCQDSSWLSFIEMGSKLGPKLREIMHAFRGGRRLISRNLAPPCSYSSLPVPHLSLRMDAFVKWGWCSWKIAFWRARQAHTLTLDHCLMANEQKGFTKDIGVLKRRPTFSDVTPYLLFNVLLANWLSCIILKSTSSTLKISICDFCTTFLRGHCTGQHSVFFVGAIGMLLCYTQHVL